MSSLLDEVYKTCVESLKGLGLKIKLEEGYLENLKNLKKVYDEKCGKMKEKFEEEIKQAHEKSAADEARIEKAEKAAEQMKKRFENKLKQAHEKSTADKARIEKAEKAAEQNRMFVARKAAALGKISKELNEKFTFE